MSKHTPTPWYVTLNPFRVGHRTPLDTLQLVAEFSVEKYHTEDGISHMAADDPIALETAKANAEFAVLAVNSHDELLGAVKMLLKHYAPRALECDDWALSGNSQTDAVLRAARAVIAKAERK